MKETNTDGFRAKEESLLGSLLAEFPTDLPENIQQMLLHAPGSFSEPLAGMAASAIRRLWKSGQSVDSRSVIKEAEAAGDIVEPAFLLNLLKSQIPLECAEADAEELFEEFRTRAAVKLLRANADRLEKHPEDHATILSRAVSGIEELRTCVRRGDLPPIIDAEELSASKEETPPEIVSGILHRGTKLILGGSSKSNKTWVLLDLAASVAYGKPWLGIPTIAGRVLYLNFELPAWSMKRRISHVYNAKTISRESGRLDVWNLRGRAASYDVVLPKITIQAKQMGYSMIVLDPIYKIYGTLQENRAEDMNRLMISLEDMASQTEAAVTFGAHFSKGNQAGKESMDRISGSGVFARDADSLLTMTAHKEPGAFTVEPTIRNLVSPAPFVVRWQFPLMTRAEELDPSELKKAPGRGATFTEDMALESLGLGGLTMEQWAKACWDDHTMSESTLHALRRKMSGKRVSKDTKGKWNPI